ncbi:MAG: type I restriction enzyme HsdR N-terminal domain-containing protein [Runella sp.]
MELNLPTFAYKITKIGGKPHIYDIIRQKYLLITPEEWVRQHVLHWLIEHHRYPKSLMRTEASLQYNKLSKRSDILVYDRLGQPFLLVECKAPQVVLNQPVFDQALRYNATLRAKYLLISNGLEHFVFEASGNKIDILPQLPAFE